MANHLRFHVDLAPIEIEFQVVLDPEKDIKSIEKAYETLLRWCKRGVSVKLDLADGFKLGLFSSVTEKFVQDDAKKQVTVKMNQTKPLKFIYHTEQNKEHELRTKHLAVEVSKMSKFLRRSQSLKSQSLKSQSLKSQSLKSSSSQKEEDDETFNGIKNISVYDMICGPEYSWTEFMFVTKAKMTIQCRVLIMHNFLQDCPHMVVLFKHEKKEHEAKILSAETGQVVSTLKNGKFEFATTAREIFHLILQFDDQECPIFRHTNLEFVNGPKYWQLRASSDSKILKRVDQTPWPSIKTLEKTNAYYSLQGCFPLDIVNRMDSKFRTLEYMIRVKSQFNLLPPHLTNLGENAFKIMLEQYRASEIKTILSRPRPNSRPKSPISDDWISSYNWKMKQERDEIAQFQHYQDTCLKQLDFECKKSIVKWKIMSKIPVSDHDLESIQELLPIGCNN